MQAEREIVATVMAASDVDADAVDLRAGTRPVAAAAATEASRNVDRLTGDAGLAPSQNTA